MAQCENMELTYENRQLQTDLSKAIERNEFQLYYQPKLDLVSGKIKGVEALIRWRHPNKGLVPPVEFISFAEESGLIIPIGEWVLRTACLQIKAWQKIGLLPMVMSVNLSVSQLYQPNFVERVKLILNQTKLAPDYLEFEITESMMMDSYHDLNILKELRSTGVKISLDDFGTGYSSLAYLKEFPISKIKIDQSFIRGCTSDSNDTTIVKTIIKMAHQLKLEVIAEGIESKEQLIFLQQNLCNEGQGYLFSKPLPPEEFVRSFNKMQQIVNRCGVTQEIGEKRRIAKALQNNHQTLLDTVRQQQMTFKYTEKNGKFIFTFCEGELLDQMGLTPEKIVGKELRYVLPDDDAEEKLYYYRTAWAGEESVMYEGKFNDICYITSLRPNRRGTQVVEVIGSCIDVTKWKRIEQSLKDQSKFRLITENIQDLIRVFDTNGIVEYASPSHEKVLGFPPAAYEGNVFFEMVHPDDIHYVRKQYVHTISSKSPCQVEFRFKHASKGWIHIEAHWTPVLGKSDEVERLIGVARDISERKKIEESKWKSEKLSVVGKLAAGVAHEIRNPLTSIKGFVQLLHKEVDNPFYINTILSEIHRLETIVEEFLTLAKPQTPQMKEIDLKILLKQVVGLFGKHLEAKGIKMIQDNELDFPIIDCDQNQIKQVFIHILQNAIEATPNGGIILAQILWHGTDYIKIQFIDYGSGISAERMKNIGEPFFSSKEKGTGLGLMISHKIVKEHGGTISIKSTVSQGTIVDIILPIKQVSVVEKNF